MAEDQFLAMLAESPQVTVFSLGQEAFAVPICRVKEIVRYPGLTKVPRVEKYVLGLANLRGEVLPVIDGRLRLGLEQEEPGERTRVLVLDLDGKKMGLVVDQILGVINSSEMQVEPSPEMLSSEVDSKYIAGVLRDGRASNLILLLDLAVLCRFAGGSQGQRQDFSLGQDAEQAAEIMQHTSPDELLVTFVTAGEEYGLPIDSVYEVIKLEEVTQVPDVPDFILGLINVRDEFLPLVDFRTLLALDSLLADINFSLDSKVKRHGESFKHFLEVGQRVCSGQLEAVDVDLSQENCPLTEWFKTFRTASEKINQAVAKVLMADQALHNWAKAKTWIQEHNVDGLQKGLAQLQARLGDAMDDFRQVLEEEIAEDQRVVVMGLGQVKVGLLVDRMSQVLRVPKDNITDPPRLLNRHARTNLKGIARLKEGERIILLLSANDLFDVQLLTEIQNVNDRGEPSLQEKKNKEMEKEVQLVTFVLGTEEFALPIEDVQEINRLSELTRVPRTPDFVEGVMNVRGNVIPAISLRKKFLWPSKDYDEATKVLIVHLEGQMTGLIVDGVSEVLRVPQKAIEPPPEIIGFNLETKFLRGVVKVQAKQKMILLLELNQILNVEEKKQLQQGLGAEGKEGLLIGEGSAEERKGEVAVPVRSAAVQEQSASGTGAGDQEISRQGEAEEKTLSDEKNQTGLKKGAGLKKKALKVKGKLKKAR